MRNWILSLVTVFTLCGVATTAAADEGGGDKPLSAGLLLGYGLDLEEGSLNPWGLGFGVGGGYTLGIGVYVGGRFVYYLGEDDVNVWELGAEGGYELDMGSLTIRPGLGIGIANVGFPSFDPTTFSTTTETSTELYIAPGGAVLYDLSENMFVGGELRLQLILSDPGMEAIIILANGGMRF